MRTNKELLRASLEFARENPVRSWAEIIVTLLLTAIVLPIVFTSSFALPIRILSSIMCGLLYVRLFVIYHDYQHRAILQHSALASILMNAIGIYMLAPKTIWIRSHEHHHNNNSKLTIAGIGSYPTISKDRYLTLTKKEQRIYLINRHPATILLGYFTLFIYWLNLKSFIQSPGRHIDSLVAIILHVAGGTLIWYYLGVLSFLLGWFAPFLLAFAIGSYLFYCQHNFPGAKFKENTDWTYVNAALSSTSFMVMDPVMHWFTGNIGYHHVHHVNSRIPFYRLKEARNSMPELMEVTTTSWNPFEVIRCFRLKLWDAEKNEMIRLPKITRLPSALA